MNLETVYKDLREAINGEINADKIRNLLFKLEDAIRKETCYKTSSKTRVNAIKRVASKDDLRPVLQGYGIYEDYKVVTDSYHLIAVKEDNMPVPVVESALIDLGINVHDYVMEHGSTSVIRGTYPNMKNIINFDKEYWNNEITLDYNDVESFYKLHKNMYEKTRKEEDLYKLGSKYYDIKYIKNVIDVLGTNCKLYSREDASTAPLYFINDKDELGLVLPIRVF